MELDELVQGKDRKYAPFHPVNAIQVDGERAWSSPIWVDLETKEE